MVRIIKQTEPKELSAYKRTQNCSYSGLRGKDKIAVYKALIKEQYGLCAYCMCRIFYENEAERNIQIEHFLPQSENELGTAKSLDYKNMLGVCDGGISYNKRNKFPSNENISCDAYKGDKRLSLNPSDKDDFEKMKIYYSSSGRIHSENSHFDEELNSVLNLNTQRLIDERKKIKHDIIKYISLIFSPEAYQKHELNRDKILSVFNEIKEKCITSKMKDLLKLSYENIDVSNP